jgi:hypothetical protein
LLSSRDAVIACGYAHQILNQNGARILMNYIPDADGRFLTASFLQVSNHRTDESYAYQYVTTAMVSQSCLSFVETGLTTA